MPLIGYPTIVNSNETIPTTYAGDVMNVHQNYKKGVDVAATNPLKKVSIGTETAYKHLKFQLWAANLTNRVRFASPTISSDVVVSLPNNLDDTQSNELLFKDLPTEIKYKVIDTGTNTIQNLRDSNFASDAAIADNKLAPITKSKLPSTAVYTDQPNSFATGQMQTFRNDNLRIWNPTSTFGYIVKTSAIVATRNVTYPLLTADDVYVFENHSQAIANKAINSVTNILQNSGNYLIEVFKNTADSLWKARNTKTGAIISSNTSPTTVIQAAINGLTASRTWQEGVKIHSPGANESIDIWQILIPSYTILDYSECLLKTVRPAGMVDDDPTDNPAIPSVYDGVSILTNTTAWDAADMSAVTAVKDITIICGKGDGNRFNLGNDDPSAQSKNFIYFVNADNVTLVNPWIIRAQHDGIRLKNCTNGIVYRPYIENNRSEGISFRGGSNNVIIDGEYLNTGWSFFTALDCSKSLFIGGRGYRNGSSSSSANISSKQCIVDGFHATNVNGGGISIGDDDGSHSTIYAGDETIVMNCTLDGIGTTAITVLSFRTRGIKILNNTIKNVVERGIALGGPADGFLFSGNKISDCGHTGIYLNGTTGLDGNGIAKLVYRGIITNNNIKNCGQDTAAVDHLRSGIAIYGSQVDAVTDIICTNNHCFDDQAVKTQKYGILAHNTLDCDIYHNNCKGNLTDGMAVTGTNNILTRYNNKGYSANQGIPLINQSNSWTGTQTFRSGLIRIFDPAVTNPVNIKTTDGMGASRDVTIPALLANDLFMFNDHIATITGKTVGDSLVFNQIAVPSDPTSGKIKIFLDSATGELSVRKAGSTTVSLESAPPAGGSGDVIGGTSLGTGVAVYKQESAAHNLEFKSITSGSVITVAANGDGNHIDLGVAAGSIVDSQIGAHTSSKITITDKTHLPTDTVYTTLPSLDSTHLEFVKPHTDAATEMLMKWRLDEDVNSYFSIENGTSANAKFGPIIISRQWTDAGLPALIFSGRVHGSFDTGNVAIVRFDARTHNNVIAVRPLYAFANNGIEIIKYMADKIILGIEGGTPKLMNIEIGNTTSGTKIGTASTQKIGFWNQTPVAQPAGIADVVTTVIGASYTATEQGIISDLRDKFNSLITKLETIGILATV